MKPLISAIAGLACLTIGVSAQATEKMPQTSANSGQRSVSVAQSLPDLEPEIGVIRQVQQGDLMCYIRFTDEAGKQRTVGATFELCENPQQYVNQRVRLVYGVGSVNDCQSNEPCGRSRQTYLVMRMDPVDRAGRVRPANTVVLANKDWTITVGNRNSWSGVNGTGNLTYRGCNSQQGCINLKGGTVTCRNGLCATVWRNGVYSYTLTSPITESSTPTNSTLTIRRNGAVLQQMVVSPKTR